MGKARERFGCAKKLRFAWFFGVMLLIDAGDYWNRNELDRVGTANMFPLLILLPAHTTRRNCLEVCIKKKKKSEQQRSSCKGKKHCKNICTRNALVLSLFHCPISVVCLKVWLRNLVSAKSWGQLLVKRSVLKNASPSSPTRIVASFFFVHITWLLRTVDLSGLCPSGCVG